MLPRTPFGPTSTGDDVAAAVDLTGRHAIVTGSSSGIGFETARVLASRGADVTIASRSLPAGERAVAQLHALTGNRRVRAGQLDLADRRSIQRFSSAWAGPLDILVNNAGAPSAPDLHRTADGWEWQFGTNFLGHFRLTTGLFEFLAAATEGSRVVSVSAGAHLCCPVVFDDINYRFRPYEPVGAYGQSKTAAVLLAVAITAKWESAGVLANAVNPGAIIGTGPRAGLPVPVDRRKTVQQGAATTILAAVSPLLQHIGGRYLEDCNQAPVVERRTVDLVGVAPYALDPDNADRLWAHASRSL